MDTSVLPASDNVRAMHEYLVAILQQKFSKVPRPLLHAPSAQDFYDRNATRICLGGVPHDVEVDVYLSRYNELVKTGFRAYKTETDASIPRIIWYWGTDERHSFTMHHRNSRSNLLFMVIALAAPAGSEWAQRMDAEKFEFCLSYMAACLNNATRHGKPLDYSPEDDFVATWLQSRYDLAFMTSDQDKRMRSIFYHLFDSIKDDPFPAEHIFSAGAGLSIAEFRRDGPAWAAQFLRFYKKHGLVLTANYHELGNTQVGDAMDVDAQPGLAAGLPAGPAIFREPHIQAAMTPINPEIVQRQKPKFSENVAVRWIDPEWAMDEIEKHGDEMTRLMKKLNLDVAEEK